MFKLTISAFILCFLFSSCGKGHCGKATFTLGLVAFNNSESDTIILRRFTKSTNFSFQQDSIFIDTLNTYFQKYSDTTIVRYQTPEGLQLLTDEYDYEIFLPESNSIFRLTDITYTKLYQGSGEKVVCYAKLNSYKINGQLKTTSENKDYILIDK